MPTIDCGHWNGRRNRLPHLAGSIVGEIGGAGGFACLLGSCITGDNCLAGYTEWRLRELGVEDRQQRTGVCFHIQSRGQPKGFVICKPRSISVRWTAPSLSPQARLLPIEGSGACAAPEGAITKTSVARPAASPVTSASPSSQLRLPFDDAVV